MIPWLKRRYDEFDQAYDLFSKFGGRLISGAIAFYAMFSIAPILFFALRVAAMVAPPEAARATLFENLARWVGRDGARTILEVLSNVETHEASVATQVLAVFLLIYASTGLFSALRRSISLIWGVPMPTSNGFFGAVQKELKKRLLSFAMVMVVAGLLVVLLVAKTLLAKATVVIGGVIHGAWLWQLSELAISWAILALLLFLLFLILPVAKIHWRDALTGAVQTSLLLSIGSMLIATYLGRSSKATMFGAASSIVFLLLWVHYSAQVFLFGVALTKVHAKRKGRLIGAAIGEPKVDVP